MNHFNGVIFGRDQVGYTSEYNDALLQDLPQKNVGISWRDRNNVVRKIPDRPIVYENLRNSADDANDSDKNDKNDKNDNDNKSDKNSNVEGFSNNPLACMTNIIESTVKFYSYILIMVIILIVAISILIVAGLYIIYSNGEKTTELKN
jgi:hypothetical protein